jgi:hypothetical protein
MNRPRLQALVVLSLATLSASAFAQNANSASPGTVNYVEGSASIEGRQLNRSSVGHETLEAGQYLSTAEGRVEVLLTPGIFLRLGKDTTIQMVSPNLTHTEIKLEHGQANVEVDQIFAQNTILIDQQRGQTQILKRGLYAFNADNATVRVFDGEASVFPGENLQSNVKPVQVKGDRELALNGDQLKPQKFNKNQAQDPLYKWSSLRSQYLGDANADLASDYAGSANFNPGWYWAGGPYGYTWLPGSGLFWNPFGYGFYSPYYLYGGGPMYGRYGYGYGGYYGGRGYYSNPGRINSPGRPGFNGGGNSGGFHGGGSGSTGGSHGGGGGGHR